MEENIGDINRWDMKRRSDKLEELRRKYPELDRAIKICGLYIKINNLLVEDKDVDESFKELEKILGENEENEENEETEEIDERDKDSGDVDNFEQFIKDMEKAGIDYDGEYHGRFFYHGPAVRTKEKGFPTREDVIRATKVKLQWDNLGLDYIVYPVE